MFADLDINLTKRIILDVIKYPDKISDQSVNVVFANLICAPLSPVLWGFKQVKVVLIY